MTWSLSPLLWEVREWVSLGYCDRKFTFMTMILRGQVKCQPLTDWKPPHFYTYVPVIVVWALPKLKDHISDKIFCHVNKHFYSEDKLFIDKTYQTVEIKMLPVFSLLGNSIIKRSTTIRRHSLCQRT